jgi:hypothetical protein
MDAVQTTITKGSVFDLANSQRVRSGYLIGFTEKHEAVSMPKRIIRIGIGGATGEPVFWTEAQIQSIRDALGKQLPKQAWVDIAIATTLYQFAAPGERSALSTKSFISRLQRLDKSLQSVRQSLSMEPPEQILLPRKHIGDLKRDRRKGISILNQIERRFFTLKKSNPSHQIDVMFYLLIHAIDALSAVSAWIRYEVSHPQYHGFKEGWTWEIWVSWLTIIMKEHGLPYKVSKGTVHPSAKISPFVNFLWELQAALPKELRRFHHSKDALAQGIWRARRGKYLEGTFGDAVAVEWFLPNYRKLFPGG